MPSWSLGRPKMLSDGGIRGFPARNCGQSLGTNPLDAPQSTAALVARCPGWFVVNQDLTCANALAATVSRELPAMIRVATRWRPTGKTDDFGVVRQSEIVPFWYITMHFSTHSAAIGGRG